MRNKIIDNPGFINNTIHNLNVRYTNLQAHIAKNKKDKNSIHRLFKIYHRLARAKQYQAKCKIKQNQ